MRNFAACSIALLVSCAGSKPPPPAPPAGSESSTGTPVDGESTTAPQADAPAPAIAGMFTFDWSPPCRVPVVEETLKKGHTVKMSYTIDARPGEQDGLEIYLEDFEFLAMDGVDVTGPESQAQLAPAKQLVSAIPILLIDTDGIFVGVRGLEEMVDRVIEQLGDTPEKRAQLRKLMTSPQMIAVLEEQVATYWRTWVEAWLGWNVAAGQHEDVTETVEAVDASAVDMQVRRAHLGQRDGLVSLTMTSTVEGEDFMRAMRPLLQSIAAEIGAEMPLEEVFKEGRRVVTVSVDTDPRTLRPRRSRYEMLVDVVANDGKRERRHDVRELAWDWTNATGCGAR